MRAAVGGTDGRPPHVRKGLLEEVAFDLSPDAGRREKVGAAGGVPDRERNAPKGTKALREGVPSADADGYNRRAPST